jgi:drug/metabolite transporter (DMT)-like permease
MMATLFLGERLALYHLVGAALVAGGLRLASLRRSAVATVTTLPRAQPGGAIVNTD